MCVVTHGAVQSGSDVRGTAGTEKEASIAVKLGGSIAACRAAWDWAGGACVGAAGVSLKLGSMAGCGATDFPKVSRAAFVRGLTDAWMGALAGGSALGSGRGDKSPPGR